MKTTETPFWSTLGYGLAFGNSLVLLFTFFLAYFSEEKQVIIDINGLGEANFEFVLLIVAHIFILAGFIPMWNKLVHKSKKQNVKNKFSVYNKKYTNTKD